MSGELKARRRLLVGGVGKATLLIVDHLHEDLGSYCRSPLPLIFVRALSSICCIFSFLVSSPSLQRSQLFRWPPFPRATNLRHYDIYSLFCLIITLNATDREMGFGGEGSYKAVTSEHSLACRKRVRPGMSLRAERTNLPKLRRLLVGPSRAEPRDCRSF